MIADQMGGGNIVSKGKKKWKKEFLEKPIFAFSFRTGELKCEWGEGGQETSDFSCSAHICYLNQHHNVMPASMNIK